MDFVPRDGGVHEGEIIVTSGLDGSYPKGLPIAKITSVEPSNYTEFLAVMAEPLVDLRHLEEVLLLEQTKMAPEVEEGEISPREFIGPPEPGKKRKSL